MARMNWDRVRRARGLDRPRLESDEPSYLLTNDARFGKTNVEPPTHRTQSGPTPHRIRKMQSRALVEQLPRRAFVAEKATRESWLAMLQRLSELPDARQYSALGFYTGTLHRMHAGEGSIAMACNLDSDLPHLQRPRCVRGLDDVLGELAKDVRWAESFILIGTQGFSKKELRALGGATARSRFLN